MVSEEIMKKICWLGKGSEKQQLGAAKEIYANIFVDGIFIDNEAIQALIPIFIKFLQSKNELVQQEGAYFLMAISSPSNDEERIIAANANTRMAIDAGAIPFLVKLLSSQNSAVVDQSLMALGNISADFPQAVFESLPIPLIMAHLSKVAFTASTLRLLKNLSFEWICIPSMIEANVQPLISLLKSKDRKICEDAIETIGNIVGLNSEVCQNVLDLGVLKFMKELFNRVPPIKLLAAEFLEKVSYYGELKINKIIGENVLPIILQQINDGLISAEIKIKYLNVIKNIVQHKKVYIQNLIFDNNNIYSLATYFQSDSDELVIFALTTLKEKISSIGFQEVEQKFKRRGVEKDLQKLLDHENEEVKELSQKILELAGIDGKRVIVKIESDIMEEKVIREADEVDERADEMDFDGGNEAEEGVDVMEMMEEKVEPQHFPVTGIASGGRRIVPVNRGASLIREPGKADVDVKVEEMEAEAEEDESMELDTNELDFNDESVEEEERGTSDPCNRPIEYPYIIGLSHQMQPSLILCKVDQKIFEFAKTKENGVVKCSSKFCRESSKTYAFCPTKGSFLEDPSSGHKQNCYNNDEKILIDQHYRIWKSKLAGQKFNVQKEVEKYQKEFGRYFPLETKKRNYHVKDAFKKMKKRETINGPYESYENFLQALEVSGTFYNE